MNEDPAQEGSQDDSKPRSSILFVGAVLAAALAVLTVVVILLLPRGPFVLLPASNQGQPVPETPIVIEVVKEGAIATFRGGSVDGLQWPIFYHGGWDWLKASSYWRTHFEPDMEKRARKDLYGTGLPVLLTLDRDVNFVVPPPDVFTNVWVRVERSDSSLLAGLSFCITDPHSKLEEDTGRLFVFWQGKHLEVPFTHGCLPISIMRDGRYGIRRDIRAIWLPRTGMTDERFRVPVVGMSELPAVPYSEVALTNLIASAGKGLLLCVDVEEDVTVQKVVDFMSLCRKFDQPWTFNFHAASFE
jgi:hypothetical protein